MWVAQAMWWVAQAMWWEGSAGYVVDYTPIIEPLRGPTGMLKTSKISTQVEIASWARVWQKSKVGLSNLFNLSSYLASHQLVPQKFCSWL